MRFYLLRKKKIVYAFSQISSSSSCSAAALFKVSEIIKNQNHNSSFVFSQTKQVCRTISTLFEGIPSNENQNIQQLRTLMKNIHLSSFRSWKSLRQTSFCIQKVLNEKIPDKNQKISRSNLNFLCHILDSMNYEIELKSHRPFIESQILSSIDFQNLKFNVQTLKMIHAFSCHSDLFDKIFSERKDLEENIIKSIEQSLLNQFNGHLCMILTNIVKNGIYQSQWTPLFLQNLQKILSSQQSLQKEYKGLLNAIKLNSFDLNSKSQDQWHLVQRKPNKEALNILTEIRVINILKEMDYNVQTNKCLFNYEIDFKIGKDCIVEYHGIHHYRTNANSPIQTRKSDWKVQCFKKRGYKVCIVPFYKWNVLQTSYEKKAWLIENLENELFFPL